MATMSGRSGVVFFGVLLLLLLIGVAFAVGYLAGRLLI
jgi:hypothetical protein